MVPAKAHRYPFHSDAPFSVIIKIKKRNLDVEISLLQFIAFFLLQTLFDRFGCFFETRFFEQCKHIFFVRLNSRLIKRINAQSIAA